MVTDALMPILVSCLTDKNMHYTCCFLYDTKMFVLGLAYADFSLRDGLHLKQFSDF